MNNSEMFDALNKGVPNYVDIDLSFSLICNQCCNDKNGFIGDVGLVRDDYQQFLIDTMIYTKANNYFFDSFKIYTRIKDSETKLFISPDSFKRKVGLLLGIDCEAVDYTEEELRNALFSRVNLLQSIDSIPLLARHFPLIYDDYILSINAMKKLKDNKTVNKEVLDNQLYLYESFGLDEDFNKFMQKQVLMYTNFIANMNKVKDYCYQHPLNLGGFEKVDKDKFELYVASKYLERAISTKDNDERQRCVYYLVAYLKNNIGSNVKIKNENRKDVSYRDIASEFRKLIKSYPNMKTIDEDRSNFKGYHVKHVINHLNKYYGGITNWSVIPNGDDIISKTDKVRERIEKKYANREESKRKELVDKEYNEYLRKVKFFEESNYEVKLYGINTFAGYIAYVYPNGEVLLEKFFDKEEDYVPARDHAIYNLDCLNFERLSEIKRKVLVKDKMCKRIIHEGDWEKKASLVIEGEPSKSEEDIQKLVLRSQKVK